MITVRNAAAVAAFTLASGMPLMNAPAAQAAEPDKVMCAETYKSAQVQRKNGALKRARESLLVCVSDRCPSVMQPDCTRWLTEVEAALPTIAFAAKGKDGKDLTSVRVTVDGQVLTESLDGKSLAIDPGSHVVRFDYAGHAPIEQTVIVREGEKARVISASWAKPAEAESAASAAPPVGRRAPAAAWIFGGLGVAGLATFGILAVHGSDRRSSLERECFGSCRQDQVDSIKTELVAADVALGVGLVSGVISTILFVTGTSSAEKTETAAAEGRPSVWLGAAPRRNGGSVGLSGLF